MASTQQQPHYASPIIYEQASTQKAAKSHEDVFQQPRWRDLWAAVLYYVSLATFLSISGLNIYQIIKGGHKFSTGGLDIPKVLYSVLGGLGVGAGALVLFVFMLYKYPKGMITGCFIGTAVLLVGFSVVNFVQGDAIGGGFMFVFALLQVVLYFLWKKRIPFSAVLLKNAVDIMTDYPNTMTASLLSSILTLGILLVFVFSCVGAFLALDQYGENYVKGTFYYSLFSIIWTSEVIRNVGVVTVSGVFATRYFLGKGQTRIPNPTLESAKRAMTYSFGSICFGSLIVAIIEFVKALVDSSADRHSLAGAVLSCLLGMIENLVRYFNKYAYTQIAIYGKPYMESAKSTWALITSRGISAIINDSLVGTALGLGAAFVGFISMEVTLLMLHIFKVTKDTHVVEYGLSMLFSWFLAFFTANSVLSVINSGVTTTFVCLAEDPAALQRTDPELYQEVASKYGSIVL